MVFLFDLDDYPKVKGSKIKIPGGNSREDGVIDWRMSANSIHNLVRALSKPYAEIVNFNLK